MTGVYDEALLDDAEGLTAADPSLMLRTVATSAAQVRQGYTLSVEAGLESIALDGRPRAVVVLGMGGSGIAGDVLGAVAGPASPVPVIGYKSYGLPGWVGAADLVVAVSCSGRTEETLSAFDEAARRGARLAVVGGADSPLHDRALQAKAPFVPVPEGRQPRASIWALSLPLLAIGHHAGLLTLDPEDVEAAAQRLEQVAELCRPDNDAFVNPAKSLALALVESLPMVWGCTPLTAVAAYRFCCQLNENAKYPAIVGALPEANHNQVVAFDGVLATSRAVSAAGTPGVDEELSSADEDLFRDRADVDDRRLGLFLLRDPGEEHEQVVRRIDATTAIARDRGVRVTEVPAEGVSRLERLAGLVGVTDFASVYLGLLLGIDPTPVEAIEELKRAIAR